MGSCVVNFSMVELIRPLGPGYVASEAFYFTTYDGRFDPLQLAHIFPGVSGGDYGSTGPNHGCGGQTDRCCDHSQSNKNSGCNTPCDSPRQTAD